MTAKTAPSSSPLLPSSSQKVRTTLLSIIGLEQTSAVEKNGKLSPTSTCDEQSDWTEPEPMTQQTATPPELLKYDKEHDLVFSPKRKEPTSKQHERPKKKRKRKNISFDENVRVQPIPTRDEYSNRVRQRIWSNAREIHQNAARNTVEFLSEGWNWRTVAEDEAMHLCNITGELIHPIHYANLGIQPGEFVP